MYLVVYAVTVYKYLPCSMDDKTNKEDDKEMVGEPKYFKIGSSNGFSG